MWILLTTVHSSFCLLLVTLQNLQVIVYQFLIVVYLFLKKKQKNLQQEFGIVICGCIYPEIVQITPTLPKSELSKMFYDR